MNFINAMAESRTITHLVMTLLHSLWQGALAAGLLWCVLTGVTSQANKRYVMSLLILALLVVGMFVTYCVLEQSPERTPLAYHETVTSEHSPVPSADLPNSSGISSPSEGVDSSATNVTPDSPRGLPWQHYVFLAWCAGVCIMLVRMVIMLGGALDLHSQSTPCTDHGLMKQIESLQRHLGIVRRVGMGFSSKVLVPCTVGLLRPVIILPAAMVGMNPADAETILLHELAHIKRCDWLVNIVQMAVEALLFFNPAVWWISRQIRIEREAACDRYAVTRAHDPITYAQLLLNYAAEHCRPITVAALALKGSVALARESRGSLSERVKRLVVPGYRPTVHPGIVPVLLTLIALYFCGMGTYKTTHATVRYFGAHMTPQQRAEAVATLKEDYRPDQRRQADLPEDQWIRVKGRVVTIDSQALPTKTHHYNGKDYVRVDASLMTRTSQSSASQSLNDNGTFDFTLRQSRFTVSVTCAGYATKHVQKDCEPGAEISNLVIELDRGYTAYIKCVDVQGRPVADARLVGGYPSPPNYGSYIHSLQFASDKNGLITITNASDALMSLTCQAPGYAKARQEKFSLTENEVREWVLKPSMATDIYVVDKQTGLPIAGAPVYVEGKEFSGNFSGDSGETQTDGSGHAVLESLAPGESYLVMIRPAQMQRQYVVISPGQSLRVECEPAQPIRGRIVGDLSRLSQKDDRYYISRTNSYHFNDSGHSDGTGNHQIFVEVINDQEARFEVDDYYGQNVTLTAGKERVTVDVEGGDDLDNVLINLSPETLNPGTARKVTFNFSGIDCQALLMGQSFTLNYRNHGETYSESHDIEINDGRASVYLAMPNSVSWESQVGTPFYFKRGHERLDEDRDYTFNIACYPAGSLFGVVEVPREAWYQHAYARLLFHNRDTLFDRVGFLPNNDLNMTTQAQSKFMFSPLPLEGHYSVVFQSGTMFILSDEIDFTPQQPLCEMTLAWPRECITLSGRILNHHGQPADHVAYRIEVKTEHHSHAFLEMRTDANGTFHCANINADTRLKYALRVEPEDAPWMIFPIKTSENPTTVKLEKGILLRGVLKDQAGRIRPNDQISLSPSYRIKRPTRYCSRTIKTNARGEFEVVLADIDYTYYASHLLSEENGRKSWTSDPVTLHPAKDQDVTLISDPN